MGPVGCGAAAVAVVVDGRLEGSLSIWKWGSEELLEEWNQNIHGSCVGNSVPSTASLSSVHGVEDCERVFTRAQAQVPGPASQLP